MKTDLTVEKNKIELLNKEIETLEKKIESLQKQIDSKKSKISKIEHFMSIKGVKTSKNSNEDEE